jgi:6-phosphogluconolactonase
MSVPWQKFPTPEAAAEACCRRVASTLEETLSGQEIVTFAVSGGSTPKLLFQRLVASGVPWKRVHLFWVDERCVPPASAESNFRLAEEHLLVAARVPRGNIHRIHAELMPDHAARHYSEEIRDFFGLQTGEMPQFDVVQLGLGSDAHTGSLFPGEPLIENREGIAAAVYVESLKKWRVTLLPGALTAAKHSVFLVAGADKAQAVRNVLHAAYDPMNYPAQIVTHHSRRASWFLDEDAASLLD